MMALLFFVGMANAQVVVDFETGDASQLAPYNLSFNTYPWSVQNVITSTGSYCFQCGNSGVANSTSSFWITVNYGEPGYITFDAKCMGSFYAADCNFYIDGDQVFYHSEDISGWNTYGYNVSAGSHEFTWEYDRSSYTPEGDYFQVDNITFGPGTACIAPFGMYAYSEQDFAYVEWEGCAETYTLRYKKGSGSWNTVSGIEDQYYYIEDLTTGNYTVAVQSDCAPGTWASASFMIHVPMSTADWYGYTDYASHPDLNFKIVSFDLQDLATVTAASETFANIVYGAVFVKGEVWFSMYNADLGDYSLYKAPIDIYTKTVGTPELMLDYLSTTAMAYNPANGLVYFYDDIDSHLKSFNPEALGPITDYGAVDNYPFAFAINKEGQAYVIVWDDTESDNTFSSVNLTNGSTTVIGVMEALDGMAFDLVTDELFAVNDSEVYYIDPQNPQLYYVGEVGGSDPVDFDYGFFMVYDWDAVVESNAESVNLYPNPTQGQVTVEGTGVLSIVNMLGQTILTQEIEEKATIELPKGMYIVRLNNAVSKLVVE